MEITQTDTQLTIKTRLARIGLVFGLTGFLAGIAFAIYFGVFRHEGMPAFMIAMFSTLFLVFVFGAKDRTVSLVKHSLCAIETRHLIGGRVTTEREFDADEITAVELITIVNVSSQTDTSSTLKDSLGRNQQTRTRVSLDSTLSVVLTTDERIAIAFDSAPDQRLQGLRMTGWQSLLKTTRVQQKAPLSDTATLVGNFLEVPINRLDMNNLAQAPQTILQAVDGQLENSTPPKQPLV
jgi:hypothetical protein